MPFGLPFTTINPYQAIPLSDVVLMRLHHMEIEQSPHLAQALMPAMIRRFQQTETLLAIAHGRNIKDRLRQLIPFLKQELGLNNQNELESQVKLTKQQLAHMIGATRPTVSKFLGELSQEGIEL